MYREYLQQIEEILTEKNQLKQLGLTKKELLKYLKNRTFRSGLTSLAEAETISCAEVLRVCHEVMEQMSPEPECGWLELLFQDGKHVLFPENFPAVMLPEYRSAAAFYRSILRFWIHFEMQKDFQPTLHFALASSEEQKDCQMKQEYQLFLDFCDSTWLMEFMRIASEITPFNTLGHIAGVHHVAMVMARQLKEAGAPVDLALMSAAAIGHDIGKFGCKDKEARRVPYLHYYYTDQCLKRNQMPGISYIAANHSTWDLELENLSLESLLLIYSDFRVKSTRENGVERIHFYSLKDSFDVILGKLDNVDDAKEKRYRKVYSKLVDFEHYMHRLGVHTDFSDLPLDPPAQQDPVLLDGEQIVDTYKNAAVRHNVRVMHVLNDEFSFMNILEQARSEKDWKNTRTYLNIFREYSTYMNQRQKLMTIDFLYELLMHRESDIRGNACELMGELIARFDVEYRKEIPEGMLPFLQEVTSLSLFSTYLNRLLFPDHKLTEQHRKWLGYKTETLCRTVLNTCRPEKRQAYMNVILGLYKENEYEFTVVFYLIHTLSEIFTAYTDPESQRVFLDFCIDNLEEAPLEVQVAALRYLTLLLEQVKDRESLRSYAHTILGLIPDQHVLSILYMKRVVRAAFGEEKNSPSPERIQREINTAFLENLKTATPWVCKVVNIRFLMEALFAGSNQQPVHTITHLANLLTGSECIDVRQLAGESILKITGLVNTESCNEVAIELVQSLELGENEYSKNIPFYLARLILTLNEQEQEELIRMLEQMMITGNDSVACVTLDTAGELLTQMSMNSHVRQEFKEKQIEFLLGTILRGMTNEHDQVAREANYVMGEILFGNRELSLEHKNVYFQYLARKAFHVMTEQKESELGFMINAAALNHVYRFISEYILETGALSVTTAERVAFFPGTFDPFSLSHKGIVKAIRKLGYEVFLAIDEFSWSKKTQPRRIRRKIVGMSTAADNGVFLFPDDVPVNIANPRDLKILREMFPGRRVYIVAGSDVTAHASAYKKAPEENSIHTFDHIIFSRHGEDYDADQMHKDNSVILGTVEELSLPIHLEDISSTRIRENIDLNRDISNLIDPTVQRYIYENNLYLREPQYKPILMTHPISSQRMEHVTDEVWEELRDLILKKNRNESILDELKRQDLEVTILRDQEHGGTPVAAAFSRNIHTSELLDEFEDLTLTKRIRERVRGELLVIKAIYAPDDSEYHDYFQMVATELLSTYVEREMDYCIYHGTIEMGERKRHVREMLERQGFSLLEGTREGITIMIASMHRPYVISGNMETVIKAPFNTNPAVRKVLSQCHERLQKAISDFDPGHLTLSFDTAIMHYRLMQKITELNNVPNEEVKPRQLGEKMCVPFGKMLRGSITPNTVTKALHTEKVFRADMSGFTIEEYPNYSPLKTQIRTIQSFDREVILVDDILHSGERLSILQGIIDESEIRVCKILTGIMTANGRDQVSKYDYSADCVYFIPDIRSWFVESTLYPFIGGDSVSTSGEATAGLITSVNLILPYVAPNFLMRYDRAKIYRMSMVCLENTREILKVLEQEYQKTYQKNLTLNRLGEVILSPTCPDKGRDMRYNQNLPASVYVENDISRLIRLKGLSK